jgi:outer membrane protein OmpA-like peptidoglycan-associated protein
MFGVGRGWPNIKAGKQTSLRLVREMLVQRKLSVSQPGDRFEQEADRVADSVMRMSGPIPSIQRMCSGCDDEMQRQESTRAPAVQRVCKECEIEGQAAVEEEEDERGMGTVQVQAMHSGTPGPTFMESSAINSLAGGGRPLPRSTRSFFESRMGHDFEHVRIHNDAHADQLARSVNARAFTRANHLVFRLGEYQPDTASGRHLLAHELAHTVQQGVSPSAIQNAATQNSSFQGTVAPANSVMPAIQRVCEVTTPPSDMTCPPATTSVGSGTPIMFGQDSNTIAATDLPTLWAIAAAWHSGGGVDVLRIDGFASCDGPASHNWRLSCNRAEAVRAELEIPSDGSPGVDPAFIEIVANGETNLFSATSLAPNRRVIISSGGTPPPGPACSLTITGPDDVDHYCAAYTTPNDSPSCPAFPAPTIVLTATGAAPTATLTWRISRGGALASIVGASTGSSVTIKGDAASGAQSDVTVQVSDGSCTTTHFLTVREPSSLTLAEVKANTTTSVSDTVTYTVRDQFGNPMGANICWDETITQCRNSHSTPFRFGDSPTGAAGTVTDSLNVVFTGGVPATLCIKLNQSITAGGCGPLLNNTILFRPTGVTLTQGASCIAGDPCP